MGISIDSVRMSVNTLRTVCERYKGNKDAIPAYIRDIAHLGLLMAEELLALKEEIAAIGESLGEEEDDER